MSGYRCRLDGEDVTVDVAPRGLSVDGRMLPYVDMDVVHIDGHTVALSFADGTTATVTHLARRHDEFLLELGEARRRARRAALLQWTGDRPIDEYDGRRGDEPVKVTLFADGITVDGWSPPSEVVPFALIDDVRRDGYTIAFEMRGGIPPVVVRQLGRRTDEFLEDVTKARNDLARRTAEAYATLADTLTGFSAPDGWAVTASEAGTWWGALRAAVGAGRAAEVDTLDHLASELRLGIKAQADDASMPFVLAARDGKVAVEGAQADEARATFVFRTDDIDRLNAALLLTSFRREAISLPEDQLGRWALAVRSLEVVRWARAALVARVVHDDAWADHVTAALSS